MPSWKTLSRHVALNAPPYIRVWREVVEVAPGIVVNDFWQVKLPDFAVVVPVLKTGRIMTLTSYLHGVRRECLGFPGGFIEEGEGAEGAAIRELAEETGLRPEQMISLGDFIDNSNQGCGHGYYFLALECAEAGGLRPDPTEVAICGEATVEDLDKAVFDGRFAVIHHVAAWCLARRHADFPEAISGEA